MGRTNEGIAMASETLAGDLLGALTRELKVMPDIWPKLSEQEQNEIIERLRMRVADNVRQAVKLIASEKRVTVVADLKKIVFGEKVEAVLAISDRDPARLDLADARGQMCLIVVADSQAHMGGLDDVKGEPDQPDLPGVDGDGAGKQIIEQISRRSKKKQPPKDEGEALH
ncbi:hypothetical protein [Paraburkholderia hospita]|uniref:hypothetical protein n=1 Tax=Paraburkholderia hospita TaxID=169430 RepID=UPI000DEEF71D|nr:hypothetical protein [Paraburkholderia hospita]AXF04769.1 hypothetical protein CUJ88_41090 [Paraburkholderia hospita]